MSYAEARKLRSGTAQVLGAFIGHAISGYLEMGSWASFLQLMIHHALNVTLAFHCYLFFLIYMSICYL